MINLIASPTRSARREKLRLSRARRHLFAASIVLLGVAVMTYPSLARWISEVNAENQVQGYVERIEQITPQQRQTALTEAREYNASSAGALIVDPFSNTSDGGVPKLDEDAELYLKMMNLTGDVMARIQVPAINLDLPIRHGATEEVLRSGVGHIYGSSLPVGGAGSRSVLTSHAGLPEATLFSDLSQLVAGDTITIDALGETLVYRVTQIETIEPTAIERLLPEDGRDLISLVTCTPIGVNSHRLVVTAERIALDEAQGQPTIPADGGALIPLWAIALTPTIIVWGGFMVTFVRARRRTR